MRVKEDIRVAYLHGLESPGFSKKNEFLRETFGEVYDPKIDYRNPETWETIIKNIKELKPDYIVGTSMGGWFAYNIGKLLNIETILFNPALKKRTYEPYIPDGGREGPYHPAHCLILGRNDDVVEPKDTLETLIENEDENYRVHYTNEGHRTPLELFKKTLLKECN
jgi:hypothetical protein